MRQLRYLWLIFILFQDFQGFGQNCDPNGNVAIFSNYEGGNLVIAINENIPNLKIGIASYEPTNVSFTGPFVGNISEIIYAGYEPNVPVASGCGGVTLANVNAPPGVPVLIFDYPPVTLLSPEVDFFGFLIEAGDNSGITGCSTCSNDTYQGGSNTAEQVIDYFMNQFGGELRFLKTQYPCWCGVLNMEVPAACCQVLDTSTPSVGITATPSLQLCAGETIVLDAGPDYQSYQWSTGATTQTITVSNPGTYSVQVNSICGSATAQVSTQECTTDILQVDILHGLGCIGDEVQIQAQVTGGVGPYTYEWSPIFNNGPGPFGLLLNAPSITVSLQVTDAEGSVANAEAIVDALSEPEFDLGPDFEVCFPQTIGAEVTGATSYLWNTGSTNPFITVSTPGTYTLTVSNGCGSSTAQVTAFPCVEELVAFADDVFICSGETAFISVLAFGGQLPYTYAWTPTLPPLAGNLVSPAATTTYTIVVTDALGTQAVATATAVVIVENLSLDLGGPFDLCEEFVFLDAFTPEAFFYEWNTGDFGPSLFVDQPGTYTVTAFGECSAVEASVEVLPCILPLEVSLGGATICPGANTSLNAIVSGGLPPYSYVWSPSANINNPLVTTVEATTTYQVTVTDAQGNQATASATVSVIQENLQVVNLGPDRELCDGAITLNAAQAQAVSYLWNTGSTQASIAVNEPGTYSVTVNGACSSRSGSVNITACTALQLSLQGATICPGESTTLQAVVSGGTPPYQYIWTPNLGSGPGPYTVSPEFTSQYSLSITDAEGTSTSATALVQVVIAPVLPVWDQNPQLCPGESFVLSALSAGVSSYQWSTGGTSSSILVSNPGTYTVSVSTPCTTLVQSLTVVPGPSLQLPPFRSEYLGCEEEVPILIGLTSMGSPQLTWDDGSKGPTYSAQDRGIYEATLENECGSRTLRFEVMLEQCECYIYVPSAFTPDANGINDIFKPSIDCPLDRYEFRVFNRWGQIVFESLNPAESWRGEMQGGNFFVDAGVYYWMLTLQPTQGRLRRDPIERKGHVMLLR